MWWHLNLNFIDLYGLGWVMTDLSSHASCQTFTRISFLFRLHYSLVTFPFNTLPSRLAHFLLWWLLLFNFTGFLSSNILWFVPLLFLISLFSFWSTLEGFAYIFNSLSVIYFFTSSTLWTSIFDTFSNTKFLFYLTPYSRLRFEETLLWFFLVFLIFSSYELSIKWFLTRKSLQLSLLAFNYASTRILTKTWWYKALYKFLESCWMLNGTFFKLHVR